MQIRNSKSTRIAKIRDTEILSTDTRDEYRQKLARIAMDEMYQFVGLLDAQGTMLQVNRAALEGAGLKLSDVEGKPFWKCFWWTVSAETQETLKKAIVRASKGEFIRYDVEVYGRAKGRETIIIDFSMIPIKDESGKVKFIVPEGRDITEKKAREREIAQKNVELQALLERVRELDEIKTQFFANVSHELRTPLALILGPAERILNDKQMMSPAERSEAAQVIVRNARMLLKHVNDLLDISKLEAGKLKIALQDLDIASVIRFAASHFGVLAEDRRIRFHVNLKEGVISAADPEKLQRVLMNLLSNAFKFTPDGGSIRCTLQVDRKNLIISVEDSGPGVKPELRKAIFERFRQGEGQSNRRFGGTGLGLAIAKEFVEMHRGKIEILESALGGALFQVSLPLHRLSPTPVQFKSEQHVASILIAGYIDELRPMSQTFKERARTQSESESKTKVLVVEDNVEMNRFVSQCLSDRYNVSLAFDGQEGLEMALTLHPDLIVTDIMMPKMSGPEMITEIRKYPELKNTPILLLSAKADDELKIKLLADGAQDFVAKPFLEQELLVRAANLVSARESMQEAERAKQELHDFFMQAAIPMVIVTGPEHRFNLANPPYEKFVGRKVLNKTLREAFTMEEIGHVLAILDRVYETGVPFVGKEIELDMRDSEGVIQKHWVNGGCYPFRGKDGAIKGIMAFVVDVTAEIEERKKVEESVAQLERERDLRERFVAALSHDLRTPLTTAKLSAELLAQGLSDPVQLQKIAMRISDNMNRADQMIRDLLDVTRIKAGETLPLTFEECNLSEIAGAAVTDLLSAYGDRFIIQGDSKIYGFWDCDSIRRVIENLAVNAVKYGSPSTPVTIRVRQNINSVELSVHNLGNPIPPEDQGNLFQLFKRTKTATQGGQKGWGIGLTLVQGLVEAHGGSFSVTSNIREGTTFKICLPRDSRRTGSPEPHLNMP